jgi:magnesium transporter
MSIPIDQFITKINLYSTKFEQYKQNKELIELFDEVKSLHPADIADILENIHKNLLLFLFFHLSFENQADVFMEMTKETQHFIFKSSSKQQRELILQYLSLPELVDFFDSLSDTEIKNYIQLVNKKERSKLLSLLEFPDDSAASIMNTDIVVIPQSITVLKTIYILKRLNVNKRLYQTIYIVNNKRMLMGYIELQDLVFADDDCSIDRFMRSIQYQVIAHDDQEAIAAYMTRYHLDIVPVVDHYNHFLGVITSEIIARTIEDEASEDIFRMASLSPIEESYFQTNFFKLFWQRGSILAILLLMQSISTMIIAKYTILLSGFLISCIGMVTSTGGNTSSQVSALVIRGLASGDLQKKDMVKFIKRELLIGTILGFFIALIGGIRIYVFNYNIEQTMIVSLALFFVVLLSTTLGSFLPFLLHKLKLDPAYSAGPLLATCMDILGVILFTSVILLIKYL